MFQHGVDYVDGNTNEAVSFKNVLILKASTRQYDDYGRLDVDLMSSGSGKFICGGQAIDIQWSRSSTDSPFRYTTSDGQELEFGVGRTYVAVLPTSYGSFTLE